MRRLGRAKVRRAPGRYTYDAAHRAMKATFPDSTAGTLTVDTLGDGRMAVHGPMNRDTVGLSAHVREADEDVSRPLGLVIA